MVVTLLVSKCHFLQLLYNFGRRLSHLCVNASRLTVYDYLFFVHMKIYSDNETHWFLRVVSSVRNGELLDVQLKFTDFCCRKHFRLTVKYCLAC